MQTSPDFLVQTVGLVEPETFRLWIGSRRGEYVAWVCSLVMGVMSGFLYWRDEPLPCMGIGLFTIFTIAAGLMSFSNWLERKTFIRVDSNGVVYASPIRNVRMEWSRVAYVAAAKSGPSWKILVAGGGGHFHYRTEGMVRAGARGTLRLGMKEGTRLTALIRGQADLGPPELEQDVWVCRR
jgi:hypothetical protein